MAFEVLMPQLGLTMEEGTVSQWIKHEGDEVKAGDVILEITTDKLTNEVASEHDGVLLKIVAQEGEDVPVKGTLAWIAAGLPWDFAHGVSNFFCGILVVPVISVLRLAERCVQEGISE